jgi:hypothetical protein
MMNLAKQTGSISATPPAAVMATTRAEHLSDRYVQISTSKIVDAMADRGFVVAQYRHTNARAKNPEHAAHSVVFRREKDLLASKEMTPQIIFANSHDGSLRAFFVAGIFRFVCANGLVVGNAYGMLRTRHIGVEAETLADNAVVIGDNMQQVVDVMDEWRKIEVNKNVQREYAKLAAQLRFNDASRFEPDELLRVRRPEDAGDDLWRVFNRVQEATTRGGAAGISAAGNSVVSRPLNNVRDSINFNATLWDLTAEFAAAAK